MNIQISVVEYERIKANSDRYLWLRDIGDSIWQPLMERMSCTGNEVDRKIDDCMFKNNDDLKE